MTSSESVLLQKKISDLRRLSGFSAILYKVFVSNGYYLKLIERPDKFRKFKTTVSGQENKHEPSTHKIYACNDFSKYMLANTSVPNFVKSFFDIKRLGTT